MKWKRVLVLCCGACLCGCSPSGNQRPARPEGPAGAQPQAATQQDGSSHDPDGSLKQEWQLIDDSGFIVTIDPWPPRDGAATLKAEATEDDAEQKFAGTVEFRVAKSLTNSEPWQPLNKVREDAYRSLYFEAPIKLAQGANFVQFRVQDAGDPQPTELLDWVVEVK